MTAGRADVSWCSVTYHSVTLWLKQLRFEVTQKEISARFHLLHHDSVWKVEVIMQHGTHNAQGIMFLCSELDNKRGWIKVHILSAVFPCVVCYLATYKEVDRTTVATNWNRGNVCKPNFIFHILMVCLSKISPMTPVSILLLWNWQWMSPFLFSLS